MDRIAVFSDVHGDMRALESILAAVDRAGIKRIFCLGDFCSGGADPLGCFDLTMSRCEAVLGGNHELVFIVGKVFMHLQGGWADSAYYAYMKLGDRRVAALSRLSAHGEIADLRVEMVHGSLLDHPNGFVRSAADAYMSMQRASLPLVLFGHTHLVACFTAQDAGLPVAQRIAIGATCPLAEDRTVMLNPGAGCDARGARWLELRLDGARREAVWHQTDTPGHGGHFNVASG